MKALWKLFVCVVLAGCGGAAGSARYASLPLTAGPHGGTPEAASQRFIFTCQNGTVFDCLVYNHRSKLLRTLTTYVESPLGVAAGKDGRLYVANEFGSNILVYSSGGRSLLQQLDNGGNVPIDVAVFHDALAVSNEHVLTYFRAGATKPTRTLRDPSALQGNGVAFDPSGNCYWSFSTNANVSQVDEFVACKGKPHAVPVSPGVPFGIAFDGHGNLYYTTYSTTNAIYRCAGTSSCQELHENFIAPEYISFSSDFLDLWVNDPGNVGGGTAIYEIDVATGKVLKEITAGLTFYNPPTGVAAAPGPF